METKTISRLAWHYRVATFLDRSYNEPREDFCSYVRGFLKTIIGCSFMAAAASGVLVGAGLVIWTMSNFIAWLAFLFIVGYVEIHEYAVIGGCFFVVGFAFIGFFIGRKAVPVAAKYQPDFLRDAWRSFHDKTCFRLRVID